MALSCSNIRLGRFLQLSLALPQIDQVLKPSLEFQGPIGNIAEGPLKDSAPYCDASCRRHCRSHP